MATLSVAFTKTVTVPSQGAVTGVSIFITSMTRISSPLEMAEPLWAVTRSTVPGTGALTSWPPAGAAAAGAAALMPASALKSTGLPFTTALPSPLISTPYALPLIVTVTGPPLPPAGFASSAKRQPIGALEGSLRKRMPFSLQEAAMKMFSSVMGRPAS